MVTGSNKMAGRRSGAGATILIGAASALLALSVIAHASGPGGPEDNRAYLTANGLLNRGLFELAIPEYESFLSEHPGHADAPIARYGLGVCLFRIARFEESLAQLEQVVGDAEFSFRAEALLLSGHSHLTLGQFEDAALVFQTLADEHSEHASADDAVALRVEAMYRGGEFAGARDQSDELALQFPESDLRERTELFGGMSALALDDLEDSSRRFNEMLERFPDGEHSAQATLLLARSRHRAGSAELAIRQYRRVLDQAIDAFLPEAMLGLGQLLHAAGQPDEAASVLERLLEQYPESELVAPARLQRGRVAFDGGDYDAARGYFQPVTESDDEALRDDASYWLAKVALREGDDEGAAEALSEAIRRYPDSELIDEMIYDRAIALTRAGADDSAVIALTSFRSQYPDHELVPDALYTQASIEHQRGNYDESLELCEIFLRESVGHRLVEPALFLAAENEFLSERFGDAEERYRDLLDGYVGGEYSERSRYRLGMSLHRQEQFDAGEPLLRTVTAGEGTREAYRPALLALGDGYFDAGDWARAEQALSDYLAFGLEMPAADDALLKRGLARQRQSRHDDAIHDFDAVMEEFTDSPHLLQARFERGQALVELERWDEAQSAFETVLREGNDSRFAPYAMNHLGAIAQRSGDFRAAADWFGQAGASGGEDIELSAQYERGRALVASQEYLDAAGVLAGIVEQQPDHALAAPAQAYRSIALARADRLEEALIEIEALESMDQSGIDVALGHSVDYEQAWCLLELGRDDEAAQAYRRLLDQPIARDLRAYALVDMAGIEMRRGNHDEAAPRLEESLTIIDSGSASISSELTERAVYRLGACRLRQERFDDVVELLDDFHERFEASSVLPSASLMCGEAHLKLARHSDAVDHLERAASAGASQDSYGPSLLRLGEACATLQRWERSGEAFGLFLESFPDSELWFQARFGVGWAAENAGDCTSAIESYREVVNRHDGPTAARAQFQIGECLFASGDLNEAAKELLKVDILYAYPEWSAAALFESGRCFEALGQLADARARYEEAVERFGATEWAAQATERLDAVEKASSIPGR